MMQRAIHFDWGVHTEGMTQVSGSGVVFQGSDARTGSYCVRVLNGASDFYHWFKLPFVTAKDEFFYQFAYKCGGTTNTRPILAWRKGGTVLGGLKVNTSRNLLLYTGNFSTLVGTGTTQLPLNKWCIIEVHVKIDDSAGVLEVRVDLLPELSFSGDTKPGADTTCDELIHGSLDGNWSYYDDLILNDIDNSDGLGNISWPGGAHVSLLRPNADGTTLEWTPTPGPNHYSAIDEDVPSGADSVKSTTAGQIDEFVFQDLDALAQSVKQIKFEAFALKGSELSPTKLAMGLKIGEGNELWSPDLSLALSQGYVCHYCEGDPSVAEVNNSTLKIKSAA